MTDDGKLTPTDPNSTPTETEEENAAPVAPQSTPESTPRAEVTPPPSEPTRQPPLPPLPPLPGDEPEPEEHILGDRVARLSGEPAPDISPEEFARLQRSGNPVNIDPRGRIRVNRDRTDDPGVVLRKRRAWYG